MRALSIRQPYAELILRGVKTVELRSKPTGIVGERFYIYACKAKARPPAIWSQDLQAAAPPAWLIELAAQVKMIEPGTSLPTGVIVGSAIIERVVPVGAMFGWQLVAVERLRKPRKPQGHPQPVWFKPF
jgi:hypothetical protein